MPPIGLAELLGLAGGTPGLGAASPLGIGQPPGGPPPPISGLGMDAGAMNEQNPIDPIILMLLEALLAQGDEEQGPGTLGIRGSGAGGSIGFSTAGATGLNPSKKKGGGGPG